MLVLIPVNQISTIIRLVGVAFAGMTGIAMLAAVITQPLFGRLKRTGESPAFVVVPG